MSRKMYHPFELTVPANTQTDAPATVRKWIAPGKIVRTLWVMPNGCNDMVWARIFKDETQLMPIQPDTWLKGNGVMGPFDEDITVPSGGVYFELRACSPDTRYQHKITFYLDLVEEGAQLEDVIKAVQALGIVPTATEAEIAAELKPKVSNIF